MYGQWLPEDRFAERVEPRDVLGMGGPTGLRSVERAVDWEVDAHEAIVREHNPSSSKAFGYGYSQTAIEERTRPLTRLHSLEAPKMSPQADVWETPEWNGSPKCFNYPLLLSINRRC